MPANATVPMSSSTMRGDEPRVGLPARARARSPTMTTAWTHLDEQHVGGLGREQARPGQRRRSEPLEHAVAALEPGGDPEAHHRVRHHREREHAGDEEVDRVALDRLPSASTLPKNTRMPTGMAIVTIRLSPRRSVIASSTLVCAAIAWRRRDVIPRSRPGGPGRSARPASVEPCWCGVRSRRLRGRRPVPAGSSGSSVSRRNTSSRVAEPVRSSMICTPLSRSHAARSATSRRVTAHRRPGTPRPGTPSTATVRPSRAPSAVASIGTLGGEARARVDGAAP